MASLAATLKSEVRRFASREMKKAMRPLKRMQKQVANLRLLSRSQKRTIAKLERRLLTLKTRAFRQGRQAARRVQASGPRVSSQAIRSLRAGLRMTRAQFAKLLAVSPGSIFGWET